MKVVTIVGARPQFVKCAPVSRQLRKVATEVLVHTGQHYDDNMNTIFFSDLNLPKPDVNLGIGSASHGKQTGKMLMRSADVLQDEKPDFVCVYGDTNSTVAGALAAVKLHIPIAHIEAGLRSFNRSMPKEVNRVMTDHLSTVLFCPTAVAVENLALEGITKGVHRVGDVMYDALLSNLEIAERRSQVLETLDLQPPHSSRVRPYCLATVHRAENTDNVKRLQSIIEAFQEINTTYPVIWPIHPRTRKKLGTAQQSLETNHSIRLIDPAAYLDMLVLEKNAKMILTDSGGVQKEAYWLQVPCATLRDETEWVETLENKLNVLVGADKNRIVAAVRNLDKIQRPQSLVGGGHAAESITKILMESYSSSKER